MSANNSLNEGRLQPDDGLREDGGYWDDPPLCEHGVDRSASACGGCDAHDAHCEAEWELHLRLEAEPALRVGGRRHAAAAFDSECERCGREAPVLYDLTCWTYGRPGVEGSEQTAFQVCAGCLEGGS